MNKIVNAVFIIYVILTFWVWYMFMTPMNLVYKPFDDMVYKTGDMILFHAYNNVNSAMLASYWTHVGIVYKEPGDINAKPLLFEAASVIRMKNCADRNKHGIIVTDLKTRLEKYPGVIACKFLKDPVSYEINKSFVELINYALQNMSYNDNIVHNWSQKMLGQKYNNMTNCAELSILCLIKLGLLPYEYVDKKIYHHLKHITKIKKLHNNEYYDPIELTFDYF